MAILQSDDLKVLYEQDETAWLESCAALIHAGKYADLDFDNLRELLEAMARRDRREVVSRLAVLLAHLLKGSHQTERHSRTWLTTVEVERHELELLLDSRTLRNHAELELESAYAAALRQATAETGLDTKVFPPRCPYTVTQLLEIELTAPDQLD